MTLPALEAAFARMGQPRYRAGQVYAWLQARGATSFDEMTDLPKPLRTALLQKFTIRGCGIEKKFVSRYDETVKYLYRLDDGELVEAVLMRYQYGDSLCISTQAGCKMGCVFCATALGGFMRNLSASEMLGQVHTAQRDSGRRVSHIVLMGMGEPLDNFDEVLRFLELVTSENGLHVSMRHISLSTCGIVPQIDALREKRLQLTLSVSLHAPNDAIRSRLMPVNRKWGVDALLAACRRYTDATSRRISFEYAMVSGVNDSDACARELGDRLRRMLCHVNLIPANEVRERTYRRSPRERVERFAAVLEEYGLNVTVRRTLGSDIDASCGQLRGKYAREQAVREGTT